MLGGVGDEDVERGGGGFELETALFPGPAKIEGVQQGVSQSGCGLEALRSKGKKLEVSPGARVG